MSLPRHLSVVFVAGTICVLVGYLLARHSALGPVPEPARLQPPVGMARNAAISAAGLLAPVDSVGGALLTGDPLPIRLAVRQFRALELLMTVGAAAVAFVLAWAAVAGWRRGRLDPARWAFLGLASLMLMLPQLLFVDHPSETYLYGPAGPFCLALAWAVHAAFADRRRGDWLVTSGFAALAALSAIGVGERNRELVACGRIADSILDGLPVERWRGGRWVVGLATPLDTALPQPYGIYNHRGLRAIGSGDFSSRAATWALELRTGNPEVLARVRDGGEGFQGSDCLPTDDTRADCYWVDAAGRVTPASP